MKRSLPSEETTSGTPVRSDFVIQLPSDLQVIEAAVTYLIDRCRSYGFAGARLNLNLRVGITEALANAMLYGNGRDPEKYVRVEVSLDSIRIALRVIDEGAGFDPDRVPDPTLPENLHRSSGRGLFLIRQLMDEVEFSGSGNAIRLVLLREPRRLRRSAGE